MSDPTDNGWYWVKILHLSEHPSGALVERISRWVPAHWAYASWFVSVGGGVELPPEHVAVWVGPLVMPEERE